MPRPVVATAVALLLAASPALAQSTQDLKLMSLQELLDIPVTTVSRGPDQTADVPAAVYVITQDDIRRSGATSLPELLRMVPGLQVARITAGTWAVGVRGFADRLARSMLVLIDGRSVYSPLFAGTYWETQDTLFSDIDRIEVIRGPGGTLWGANAVNGIINIITKPAAATQGVLAEAGGGNQLHGIGAVRYGGTRGDASYRMYFKALDRGAEFHASGDAYDRWTEGQGGFRADWTLAGGRAFTLEGDAYGGRLGEQAIVAQYTPPYRQITDRDAPLAGGNVIARLTGESAPLGRFQVQAYYDRTSRDEIPVAETRDTADADFQSTLARWERHTLTWGGAWRVTTGAITSTPLTSFTPARRTDNLFSGFIHDEISLGSGRWRASGGAKIEHNDYSGVEVQPSVRLLWIADAARDTSLFWAVTRAVRVPSRVETDYETTSNIPNTPLPTYVRLLPNPDFMSEKLVAYEMGARSRPRPNVYLTVSGFYNDLQDTLSTELVRVPFIEFPPTRLVYPVAFRNGIVGHSAGVEFTSDVRPRPWWRLTANYSYLEIAVSKKSGSTDVSQESRYEGRSPHHQVQAGSSFDIGGSWTVDALVRYVSRLPLPQIPAYTTANIRLGWRPVPALELSVAGQDLFHDHHVEFPSDTGNVEIRPSVYAALTWRR